MLAYLVFNQFDDGSGTYNEPVGIVRFSHQKALDDLAAIAKDMGGELLPDADNFSLPDEDLDYLVEDTYYIMTLEADEIG